MKFERTIKKALKKIGSYYPSPRISSEVLDCSLPMTFDQYNMCSYHCLYCFAHVFKKLNPVVHSRGKFKVRSVAVHTLYPLFRKGTHIKQKESSTVLWKVFKPLKKSFFKNKFVLHWGGLADPFCYLEKKHNVGAEIIELAAEEDYPVFFSTKGDIRKFDRCMKIFKEASKQGNFAFQFSMITSDENIAKEIERGVPSPKDRIKAMEKLSNLGYYCVLRFRPFIIGISDKNDSYMKLLSMARKAGARAVSIEFYALNFKDRRNKDTWQDKLAEAMKHHAGIDDLYDYYDKLSPSHRGTYKRLNRLVKERYIRKVYEYCLEHDMIFACSDPDFKELGMVGSCCGLPDRETAERLGIKINQNLFNWSKYQMTNAIIELRKKFWRGEDARIEFEDVFSPEITKENKYLTFLDDSILTNNMPAIIGEKSALRRGYTLKDYLLNKWNTQYPYKYFDGKLKPEYVKDGNIVYSYQPSDYEYRWIEEGIDLSV